MNNDFSRCTDSILQTMNSTRKYFQQIKEHCTDIGVKLLTPEPVFQLQVGTQPTKRNINIQLGCFHECVMSKMAFKIFEMKSDKCRLCEGSDIVELEQLTNQDIADGNLTQDQFESMDEDHYTLSCLRYKSKSHGVSLGELVDLWIAQDGNCARCDCKLFPTASTRSFYFVELIEDENDSEEDGTADSVTGVIGGFVCGICKD